MVKAGKEGVYFGYGLSRSDSMVELGSCRFLFGFFGGRRNGPGMGWRVGSGGAFASIRYYFRSRQFFGLGDWFVCRKWFFGRAGRTGGLGGIVRKS